jgi:hypothetical protein
MYSPQLFEMISQSIHAERIADAEWQRLASGAVDGTSTARVSIDDAAYRRLARAVATFALRAARQRYTHLIDCRSAVSECASSLPERACVRAGCFQLAKGTVSGAPAVWRERVAPPAAN